MERLLQPVVAGVVTALVGFTSSFTVVLAGLRAVGASEGQASSGLLTASVVMGGLAIWASVRARMPISIAWSTPGAALLVATGSLRGGFGAAVLAFGVCGALILLTGMCAALRKLVLAIPGPLASALLAGVLLQLCLVPVTTMHDRPALAIPIVATWLALIRLARRWAVPVAMLVALAEIVAKSGQSQLSGHRLAPSLAITTPVLTVSGVTLGLSLFVVTMASQNIPGIAVLDGFGYSAPVRRVLIETGGGTIAGAAFGGHVVNLAAISAALSAGPDAHPDKDKRWIASSFAGACYIAFGVSAGLLSALAAVAPAGLVETVAGLGLLGTLGSSLAAAATEPGAWSAAGMRDAAVVTFLVTASGFSLAGIGSPFWGLLAGLVVLTVLSLRWRGQRPSTLLTAAATSEGRP
ncbi:MAG: benzoate rane transport protein [Pseudonocardiales bacterium]|jgi:benzoate membrane transport protein|nr:benzoate rane transport protein [Pseudonocardiales bacterium]